ncbi:MAG: hypothetical protein LBR33_04180 [Propionibacteriaceae bacterium]|jgi:methanol--5-hydroxybenzimidazolylcobamide Co-methyltransferase|nr:hypothetical protein [Propionibacteriaceae bacterium]
MAVVTRTVARGVAYATADDFVFGRAARPVTTRSGLVIGGGTVFPEINFTLPPMLVTDATMADVLAQYRAIAEGICERAAALQVPGFVAEIETLPPMTFHPEWGLAVCRTVADVLGEFEAAHGVPTALRLTPNDIREGRDLEHLWHGRHWDLIMEVCAGAAAAGADLLAIESVGGKEVHDEAVMYCDLATAVTALTVLAPRDMERLWTAIAAIGADTGATPAGDTACGFANTAMVLAERHYIPRVFAAVVRVVAAVRSLVAVECGARGPHTDCGYEGVYVKAVTGTPVAMEGRTAACAHFSPVGNVAGCVADLWSNESVQNVKLLAGPAPSVSFEQLAYDCRLFNTATARGPAAARALRDLHSESDAGLDPQAWVLRPDVVVRLAGAIVTADGDYARGVTAARATLEELRRAHAAGELALDGREADWLDALSRAADDLPPDAAAALAGLDSEAFDPKKYDL